MVYLLKNYPGKMLNFKCELTETMVYGPWTSFIQAKQHARIENVGFLHVRV